MTNAAEDPIRAKCVRDVSTQFIHVVTRARREEEANDDVKM